LYYKRLEKGRFTPPEYDEMVAVSWADLVLMVEGIQVERRTQKLRYSL